MLWLFVFLLSASWAQIVEPCDRGQFPVNQTCVDCNVGTYQPYSNGTYTVCLDCDPGTFQNTTGASTCYDCPSGTFQPNLGATACILCMNDTVPNMNATACVAPDDSGLNPGVIVAICASVAIVVIILLVLWIFVL